MHVLTFFCNVSVASWINRVALCELTYTIPRSSQVSGPRFGAGAAPDFSPAFVELPTWQPTNIMTPPSGLLHPMMS